MSVVRKKQDDKNLKILRELVTSNVENRQCFDCGQKGPTYVNMTIGSFVCTRCSGVLRGLTPPHRVKSISMATFTQDEIEFLRAHGNDNNAKTWLGLWDSKRAIHQDQRELIIDKYERKRYYLEPASPLKSLTNTTKITNQNTSNSSNNNSLTNNNINKKLNENNLKNTIFNSSGQLQMPPNNNSNNISQNFKTNYQNQFTNDENGFLNSKLNINNNNNNNNTIINGSNNNSLLDSRQFTNNNSLNIVNKSKNNKFGTKFTSDIDFIADFGSAEIFNGISSDNQNGSTNQISGLRIQRNGLGVANDFKPKILNNEQLGGNSDETNANENFADFDHAPIYNAAEHQFTSNTINNWYNNLTTNGIHNNTIVNNDINTFNNINYNNNKNKFDSSSPQINLWSQFDWPPFDTVNTENRWSFPMTISSTNSSLSSSTTLNSSNNSTPSADRYAALKDLDEQLRENKVIGDNFCEQGTNGNPVSANANPFKPTPSIIQETVKNPFKTNIFGGLQSQSISLNEKYNINKSFNTQNNGNVSNGFSMQAPLTVNGVSTNGFNGHVQNGINNNNSYLISNNPFATNNSLNSNNPFL